MDKVKEVQKKGPVVLQLWIHYVSSQFDQKKNFSSHERGLPAIYGHAFWVITKRTAIRHNIMIGNTTILQFVDFSYL